MDISTLAMIIGGLAGGLACCCSACLCLASSAPDAIRRCHASVSPQAPGRQCFEAGLAHLVVQRLPAMASCCRTSRVLGAPNNSFKPNPLCGAS